MPSSSHSCTYRPLSAFILDWCRWWLVHGSQKKVLNEAPWSQACCYQLTGLTTGYDHTQSLSHRSDTLGHTLTHSHTHTMLLLILAVITPFSTTAQLVVWKWFHQFPSVWLAWLLQGKRTAANKGATVISLCEVASTVVEEIKTKRIAFCLPWFAMKKCALQDIHKYMHSVLGWESDPNKQWDLSSVDKAVNPSLPLGHDTWYKLWTWTWTTCKNSALSAWMPRRQCIPIRHLIN